MSESEISPLKQLSVLSKNLFKLLDEEFELLSGRDFLSVEEIQVQKVERMQELDAFRAFHIARVFCWDNS